MCVNNKRHPHAEVIIAWAEGKTLQQVINGKWCDVVVENPNFHSCLKLRIKPEPVEVTTCNGVVITPMKEKPKVGSNYFVAAPSASPFYVVYHWRDDVDDVRFFERGLVHRTAESAYEHALAMLNNKKELQDV